MQDVLLSCCLITGTDRPDRNQKTDKGIFPEVNIDDPTWDNMKSNMLSDISKYELTEQDVYFKKAEETNDIGWFNVYLELRTSKWSNEHESKYGVNSPNNL